MKYRLSFEFEEGPEFLTSRLMFLLFDAFGEFRAARCEGHEEDYVARRYPPGVDPPMGRGAELEEVKLRNRLASALNAGVHAELTVHKVVEGGDVMDDDAHK